MKLSLVIAAPDNTDWSPFYDSLALAGAFTPDIEILVVAPDNLRSSHTTPAGVRRIDARERSSIFALWGEGTKAATGHYLAMLDVRCPLTPNWTQAVLSALGTGAPVLYGPVACAWAVFDKKRLGYMVEYIQFHPPVPAELDEIPGNNIVIRRELATRPGILASDGFVKTRALTWLEREGCDRPLLLPDAIITYRKQYTFRNYCLHRFNHGRYYGANAISDTMRKFLWGRTIMVVPLLPALRTWRIYRHAVRLPENSRAFWRLLPRIVVAELGWSLGECVGYIAGGPQPRYLT
jgi:hypothetical protein